MTAAPERANAGRGILTTLHDLPPNAPTACEGWTAHHIAAHLAAGSREIIVWPHARAWPPS